MSLRVLMAVAALLAQSQAAAASDAGVVAPTTVQELTVVPHPKCLEAESAPAPAPKIVSTFPAEGQVVRPGLIVFRITFDRPMTCSGFLIELAKVASPCPPHDQTFIQTFDHKTVRTLCLTQPGQTYAVVVGGDCSQPFVSLDDQQAPPLAVRFRASDGQPVTSVREALAEDTGPGSPTTASAGSPVVHGLDGTWQGEITDQNGWRPLILHVSTDKNGALAATLDSPDSPWGNESGLPLWGVRLDGNRFEFDLPALNDTYSGTLSADGSTIRGFWADRRKATNFTYTGSQAAGARLMSCASTSSNRREPSVK
jgi:hypothetical protein